MRCCLYCQSWFYRIPRHMRRRHKTIPDVYNVLKMPRRKQIKEFRRLRYEGDNEANIEKLRENKHGIAVVREGKKKSTEYLPCVKCRGWFSKSRLTNHSKICVGGKECAGVKESKMWLAGLLTTDEKSKKLSTEVLSRMSEDEIFHVLANDEPIKVYGSAILEGKGIERFSEISNKLRNIGCLLIEVRKSIGNDTMTCLEMIDPASWDAIISSVKEIVKHESIKDVGTPSTLLRLGRSLEALGSLKEATGIRRKDDEVIKNVKYFLKLHKREWKTYAGHALSTIAKQNDKKPELLPLTKDIEKLRKLSKILKFAKKVQKTGETV